MCVCIQIYCYTLALLGAVFVIFILSAERYNVYMCVCLCMQIYCCTLTLVVADLVVIFCFVSREV